MRLHDHSARVLDLATPLWVSNPVIHRVLIVDDNEDLAEAMSVILTIHGYDTETAFNGRTALEKARSMRPHAVLLDIELPDFNGYEVARLIRKDLGTDNVRVIAISANDMLEDGPSVLAAKLDHYLIKPVDLDMLFGILGNEAS